MLTSRQFWSLASVQSLKVTSVTLKVRSLATHISVSDDPALYLYSGGAKETPQFLSNLVSSMMQA